MAVICKLCLLRPDKFLNLQTRKFASIPAIGDIIEGSGNRGINAYEVIRIVHGGLHEAPDSQSCEVWLRDMGEARAFKESEIKRLQSQMSGSS